MRIAIRVDASSEIGIGHIMRCMTLADRLKKKDAQVRFVCRYLPESLRDMLSKKGHELVLLDNSKNDMAADELGHAYFLGTSQHQDAKETVMALSDQTWDWLIVDHYALDIRWESKVQQTAKKVMVIDDLADRRHGCDLLFDQNYYNNMDVRYLELIPENCKTLLGPKSVLLRPEFTDAKRKVRVRDGAIQRILVFFGGSDITNQTKNVLEAFKQLDTQDIEMDIVVGTVNPHKDDIRELCDELPTTNFYCQVSNMAELIQKADLGIGAGGAAMWERCFLGLPTITVVLAKNQFRTTEDLASTGAIEYMGWYDELSPEDYVLAINRLIENPQKVTRIIEAAYDVVQVGESLEDVMMNDVVQEINS